MPEKKERFLHPISANLDWPAEGLRYFRRRRNIAVVLMQVFGLLSYCLISWAVRGTRADNVFIIGLLVPLGTASFILETYCRRLHRQVDAMLADESESR